MYHPHLYAQGEQLCQVGCTFMMDPSGGLIVGDVGVYLGDLEVYRRDPGGRVLPRASGPEGGEGGSGRGGELRAVVFREAESKFPAKAWSKYDLNITYSANAQVQYGYLDSLELLLRDASYSVQRPELRPDVVGAVILRCGTKTAPRPASGEGEVKDRRRMRAEFVEELGKLVSVKSYGDCANNAPWPPGHNRDKLYAMRRSLFCLAFENSVDPDYVTEKLFDCLRAGSVPIVSGGAHIREMAPPMSAIFVEDYGSTRELASYLISLVRDSLALDRHRQWIHDVSMPGWLEWQQRMRQQEASQVRCRLCLYVAQLRGLPAEEWSDGKLAEARDLWSAAAAQVSKVEEERRRGLSEASKVKIEL